MTKHPLQSFLESTEYRDSMQSYSGRGMYGKDCLAVRITDLGEFMAEMVAIALEQSEDFLDSVTEISEAFRGLRTDSLGLGQIAYFPRVPLVDENDETEDE